MVASSAPAQMEVRPHHGCHLQNRIVEGGCVWRGADGCRHPWKALMKKLDGLLQLAGDLETRATACAAV
jgi:hypothetical protein